MSQPETPGEPETCICAAIRCIREGRIVRGHRHGDCIQTAVKMLIDPHGCEQGFITSRNRFVGRVEGRKLQDAAGIPSYDRDGYRGDTLFSEDLY